MSIPGFQYPALDISEDSVPRSTHVSSPSDQGTSSSSDTAMTGRLSSVFDSSNVASKDSASTIPPTRGPIPLNVERPMVALPNRDPHSARLPCEFAVFSNCQEDFGGDQIEEWINHIIDAHLHNSMPMHTLCWFCDHESVASSAAEAEQQYRDRMRHIAGHFLEGSVTARQRRPDFFFLDHIWNHRLISQAAFEEARAISEVPPHIRTAIRRHRNVSRVPISQSTVIIENRRSRRRDGNASSSSHRVRPILHHAS
jgi:hypothetical protein